jgi:hypothetical protein
MDYLPGGADDMSYMIKKVTFKLHETYTNPNRGTLCHIEGTDAAQSKGVLM